jgi:antitoxin component of MazEF toxin-antitoxin module
MKQEQITFMKKITKNGDSLCVNIPPWALKLVDAERNDVLKVTIERKYTLRKDSFAKI